MSHTPVNDVVSCEIFFRSSSKISWKIWISHLMMNDIYKKIKLLKSGISGVNKTYARWKKAQSFMSQTNAKKLATGQTKRELFVVRLVAKTAKLSSLSQNFLRMIPFKFLVLISLLLPFFILSSAELSDVPAKHNEEHKDHIKASTKNEQHIDDVKICKFVSFVFMSNLISYINV